MSYESSGELFYLTLTVMLTGVLWIPYIINRILELGLWTALKNPNPDEAPKAMWAYRMIKAHQNAVENLVVFAPLILMVVMTNSSNSVTHYAAMIFFISRLAHAVIYTLGVPLLRTVSFFIGFACQVVLAIQTL